MGTGSDLKAELATLRGSHRYVYVFALVLAIILVVIAIPPDDSGRGVLMVFLAAATLFAAVWISGTNAWTPRIVAGLVAFAAVAALVTWITPGITDEVGLASRLVVLSVVIVLPFVIGEGTLRAMREDGVTLGVVFGAVSNYLLIAIAFAVVYAIIGDFTSPFFAEPSTASQDKFPFYMYFSVITQSTVGYGDFVPGTSAGRAFASAQALMGQLYLVSVVALVVGNFGRGTAREQQAQQQKLKKIKQQVSGLDEGSEGHEDDKGGKAGDTGKDQQGPG